MSDQTATSTYRFPRDIMAPEGLIPAEPRAFAMSRPASQVDPDMSGWHEVDPTPVLMTSSSGQLLDANKAGHQLIAAGSAAAIRGRTISFTDTQAQQAFLRTLGLVVSRRTLAKTVVLRGNDGAWRQLEVRASPTVADWAFLRFPAEPRGRIDIDPIMQAFALSPSEGEVLRRLTEGLSPKEIARALSISTNTVRAHLRMLYLKMNVRGIPGVIRQAVRLTR